MDYTRREFAKLAAAGVPAACLLPTMAHAQARPSSKWAGVQVGMNVPYNFGSRTMSAEETLKNTVALGISAVELRGQPIEAFLGAPQPEPARGRGEGGRGEGRGEARGSGNTQAAAAGRGRGGRSTPTPEQVAAQAAAAASLRKWRESASLDKARDLRALYENAGVLIEIVKWDGIFDMADSEVDYVFQVSKALGAKGLSTEISDLASTTRVGQFADRHQLRIGYHGHATTGEAEYAAPFAAARFNGANVDIGHFIAGQNTSPVPFLTRHADRITHIHVKDRKRDNGANTPFGEGDTPIREILQLMRDRKWTFQATIEFEYPVPAGSTRMAEMAKAIEYCRNCLLS